MKLYELVEIVNKIKEESPEALQCDVVVDTEARCFNFHHVEIESLSYDNYEKETGLEPTITVIPKYNYTSHFRQRD